MKAYGWCVVYTDLCDPVENPSVKSCKRGFLQYFRKQMRGFHDWLRQKLFSVVILFGWSSVSVTFSTYIISGIIGLHIKIYWHFIRIASKCDGNVLRSENLCCEDNLFLHIICTHTLSVTSNFILSLRNDVAWNWHFILPLNPYKQSSCLVLVFIVSTLG